MQPISTFSETEFSGIRTSPFKYPGAAVGQRLVTDARIVWVTNRDPLYHAPNAADPERDALGDALLGVAPDMAGQGHDAVVDSDADLRRIDHGGVYQSFEHLLMHRLVVHRPSPRFGGGTQMASQSSAGVITDAAMARPRACRLPMLR